MGRVTRKRPHPARRQRDPADIRLLGAMLLAAGLLLLFLCVPGWAWAALVGAMLVALGLWLITLRM